MALVEPVPFPFEIDWSERFVEEREHETTIQEAWDGTEQRRNLSEVPNRRFRYTIKALEASHDEFQRLQAALYSGQHLTWWVPYWPRERYINGVVAVGATSIPVTATDSMALVVGHGVLLYRNPARYEVVLVEAIAPTAITVTATTLDWGRDKVIPCFRGLMAPETAMTLLDVDLASTQVTFDLDITEA